MALQPLLGPGLPNKTPPFFSGLLLVFSILVFLGSVMCPSQDVQFSLWSCVMKLPINPLNAELNPICHLVALLGVHHFLHVSRIRVKSLTLRLLMTYIYGTPVLDVSRSHTTTHHSR